jgi:hypothetical protein
MFSITVVFTLGGELRGLFLDSFVLTAVLV